MAGCYITVTRSGIKVGDKNFTANDLAAYFVWPMKNSSVNSIEVIACSGVDGMNAANENQYFAGASGFPVLWFFT